LPQRLDAVLGAMDYKKANATAFLQWHHGCGGGADLNRRPLGYGISPISLTVR